MLDSETQIRKLSNNKIRILATLIALTLEVLQVSTQRPHRNALQAPQRDFVLLTTDGVWGVQEQPLKTHSAHREINSEFSLIEQNFDCKIFTIQTFQIQHTFPIDLVSNQSEKCTYNTFYESL